MHGRSLTAYLSFRSADRDFFGWDNKYVVHDPHRTPEGQFEHGAVRNRRCRGGIGCGLTSAGRNLHHNRALLK